MKTPLTTPIVDAHAHLWLRQEAEIDGQHVRALAHNRSRSEFLGEPEVQMLPPFMIDGRNTAEVFLSNMDYAQVSAAVITQELIDGFQNDYLHEVARRWPDRFFVFGMCDYRRPGFCEEAEQLMDRGFRGIKIPAARLIGRDWRVRLNSDEMMRMFRRMEERGVLLGIELADGDAQTGELREVIESCPQLTVVIGHFGMVTRPRWMEQIRLARYPNVYIESGGITWLFHSEFYPYPSAVRAIREAADEVGIDRLMWGSDYPRTITAITYRMSYDFLVGHPLLTPDEQALFLGGNARRVFGFGELPLLPYIRNMSE